MPRRPRRTTRRWMRVTGAGTSGSFGDLQILLLAGEDKGSALAVAQPGPFGLIGDADAFAGAAAVLDVHADRHLGVGALLFLAAVELDRAGNLHPVLAGRPA